jgi:hypothetical protein
MLLVPPGADTVLHVGSRFGAGLRIHCWRCTGAAAFEVYSDHGTIGLALITGEQREAMLRFLETPRNEWVRVASPAGPHVVECGWHHGVMTLAVVDPGNDHVIAGVNLAPDEGRELVASIEASYAPEQ